MKIVYSDNTCQPDLSLYTELTLPSPQTIGVSYNSAGSTYDLTFSLEAPISVSQNLRVVVSNGLEATCSENFQLNIIPKCSSTKFYTFKKPP